MDEAQKEVYRRRIKAAMKFCTNVSTECLEEGSFAVFATEWFGDKGKKQLAPLQEIAIDVLGGKKASDKAERFLKTYGAKHMAVRNTQLAMEREALFYRWKRCADQHAETLQKNAKLEAEIRKLKEG